MTKYSSEDVQLTSIIYSELATEIDHQECTCVTPDKMAYGDMGELRQIYPKHTKNPFSFIDTANNYATATEDDLRKPFKKNSVIRFEAEYDYCMRWGADRKFVALKVIPFQSNFYSCARLMFRGRNWVLDCANYDGQYDYCGWLPTNPSSPDDQTKIIPKRDEKMSDSSIIEDKDRCEAGKQSIHSSDTCYGLQSIMTDDSELTKYPIDKDIYKLVGDSCLQSSFKYSESPYNPPPTETSTPPMQYFDDSTTTVKYGETENRTTATKTTSLDDLFYDLVELDQLFLKQVKEAKKDIDIISIDNIECLTTAQSFSDVLIFTDSLGKDATSTTKAFSDSETINEKTIKSKSLMNYLICLTGKQINPKLPIEFLKNWFGISK